MRPDSHLVEMLLESLLVLHVLSNTLSSAQFSERGTRQRPYVVDLPPLSLTQLMRIHSRPSVKSPAIIYPPVIAKSWTRKP
jgi:hypothetical protein